MYWLLKKVPFVEKQNLMGIHSYGDRYTWINSPMIEDHPIWSEGRTLGLDATDAHHLMLAVEAACDVFLTCDKNFLNLNRRPQIEDRFSIRVRRPSEFVEEMDRI